MKYWTGKLNRISSAMAFVALMGAGTIGCAAEEAAADDEQMEDVTAAKVVAARDLPEGTQAVTLESSDGTQYEIEAEKGADLAKLMYTRDLPEDFAPEAVSCAAGWVCIFTHANARGRVIGLNSRGGVVGVPSLARWACPERVNCTNKNRHYDGTWNDQMSSWQNNSGRTWNWYYNANYGGGRRQMVHHGASRIINLTPSENDNPSSLRR